jgi:hypothetical protein
MVLTAHSLHLYSILLYCLLISYHATSRDGIQEQVIFHSGIMLQLLHHHFSHTRLEINQRFRYEPRFPTDME